LLCRSKTCRDIEAARTATAANGLREDAAGFTAFGDDITIDRVGYIGRGATRTTRTTETDTDRAASCSRYGNLSLHVDAAGAATAANRLHHYAAGLLAFCADVTREVIRGRSSAAAITTSTTQSHANAAAGLTTGRERCRNINSTGSTAPTNRLNNHCR
jgi:hypothetical protein